MSNIIQNCTMQSVIEQAKKDLIDKKEHPCTFILPTKKDWHKIQVGWKNDFEKDIVMTTFAKTIRLTKPDSYFVVMEGWGVKRNPNEKLNLKERPSQSSDRHELLIINEFRRDMRNKSTLFQFERKDGNIVFVDEFTSDNENSSTAFNFYMEEGAHYERIEQLAKEQKKP
jgi:hypothetical protein